MQRQCLLQLANFARFCCSASSMYRGPLCNAQQLYNYGMFNEQAVSSQGFLWLLAAVLCVSQACLQQCSRVRAVLEEGLKAGRTPRTQWGLLLQDMQEAGQAVSEVAHGRWAKLLGSRSAECLHYCEDCILLRCLDVDWQACIS